MRERKVEERERERERGLRERDGSKRVEDECWRGRIERVEREGREREGREREECWIEEGEGERVGGGESRRRRRERRRRRGSR